MISLPSLRSRHNTPPHFRREIDGYKVCSTYTTNPKISLGILENATLVRKMHFTN